MLRKLLVCLALLTGITAAGVPAHAQVASALASRIEADARADSGLVEQRHGVLRAAVRASAPVEIFRISAFAEAIATPVVLIGCDRARE